MFVLSHFFSLVCVMDSIIEPNESFDFTKLSLAHPSGIQGGAYFTKFLYNNKPLYIQTTKGQTKQGFVKSGKKYYVDLMYDNNASSLINWLERLEEVCQSLLYEKNEDWFQGSLEKSEIENAFNPTIRVYKSGKYYLLRTNVLSSSSTIEPSVKVYSESQSPLSVSDIKDDSRIISILEVQGIKFTSRNFQIEIELKQVMILDDEPTFDNCLFKHLNKQSMEPLVKPEDTNKEVDDVIVNESMEPLVKEEVSIDTDKKDDVIIDEPTNTEVTLDIEELDIDTDIKEFDEINVENSLETITLKKPNEVYFELYREARNKAKEAKRAAIISYLEAKNIKKTYLLDDLNDSDSDFDAEIEDVSESELDGL